MITVSYILIGIITLLGLVAATVWVWVVREEDLEYYRRRRKERVPNMIDDMINKR